ncbi:MAG: hypothetical protein B7O98_06780 [Zestosphaera tikiterensis]|uniref:Uncharacterized protein n=1 Tax=Zestosphaera tikiterensis TaxID=1973259 RepID=A0A2R7Y4S0_9CREN|nr:MAG: hypothetical protein B7O98_06780 [Zestosphaera tikiterensis]
MARRAAVNEGSKYLLGALLLITLMAVSLVLGWYGLYIERAQQTTTSIPTSTTEQEFMNVTSTSVTETYTTQPTNTTTTAST